MALIKAKDGNSVYTWKSDDIRDAEIKAITEITNVVPVMQNVLGAKNMFPISLQSQTIDGEITVTVNTADKSITLNGTASTVKVINFPSTFMLPAAKWDILQFGGSTACFVQVAYNNAPAWWNGAAETHHLFELIEPKEMSAQLIIGPNTYNNETIKVMIVPQGTDPTYVPYAMTNKQLTDDSKANTTAIETLAENLTSKTGYYSQYYKMLGMGAFSVDFNLSGFVYSNNSTYIVITCSSDMAVGGLVGGCTVVVGNGGCLLLNKTQGAYLDFSVNGYVLTITSGAGYAYGVKAVMHAFVNTSIATPW